MFLRISEFIFVRFLIKLNGIWLYHFFFLSFIFGMVKTAANIVFFLGKGYHMNWKWKSEKNVLILWFRSKIENFKMNHYKISVSGKKIIKTSPESYNYLSISFFKSYIHAYTLINFCFIKRKRIWFQKFKS